MHLDQVLTFCCREDSLVLNHQTGTTDRGKCIPNYSRRAPKWPSDETVLYLAASVGDWVSLCECTARHFQEKREPLPANHEFRLKKKKENHLVHCSLHPSFTIPQVPPHRLDLITLTTLLRCPFAPSVRSCARLRLRVHRICFCLSV